MYQTNIEMFVTLILWCIYFLVR